MSKYGRNVATALLLLALLVVPAWLNPRGVSGVSASAVPPECAGQEPGFHQLRAAAIRDKGVAAPNGSLIGAGGGDVIGYVYVSMVANQDMRVWTEDTGWHLYALGPGVLPSSVPVLSSGELKVFYLLPDTGTSGDGYGARHLMVLATGLLYCPGG